MSASSGHIVPNSTTKSHEFEIEFLSGSHVVIPAGACIKEIVGAANCYADMARSIAGIVGQGSLEEIEAQNMGHAISILLGLTYHMTSIAHSEMSWAEARS